MIDVCALDMAVKPLVSVWCLTYNFGPYIRQALDGFLMQKTDFPFEILVHDDFSTDDTMVILREYQQRRPTSAPSIYTAFLIRCGAIMWPSARATTIG